VKGRGRQGRGGILLDQSKYGCYGPGGYVHAGDVKACSTRYR